MTIRICKLEILYCHCLAGAGLAEHLLLYLKIQDESENYKKYDDHRPNDEARLPVAALREEK